MWWWSTGEREKEVVEAFAKWSLEYNRLDLKEALLETLLYTKVLQSFLANRSRMFFFLNKKLSKNKLIWEYLNASLQEGDPIYIKHCAKSFTSKEALKINHTYHTHHTQTDMLK